MLFPKILKKCISFYTHDLTMLKYKLEYIKILKSLFKYTLIIELERTKTQVVVTPPMDAKEKLS